MATTGGDAVAGDGMLPSMTAADTAEHPTSMPSTATAKPSDAEPAETEPSRRRPDIDRGKRRSAM